MKFLVLREVVLFSALALFFNSNSLQGQHEKIIIKKGKGIQRPKNAAVSFIQGNDHDGLVYVTAKHPGKVQITAINPYNLNEDGKPQEINLRSYGKGYRMDEIVSMKGHCYWLCSRWNSKEKKDQMSAWVYDAKQNQVISKNMHLLESGKLAGEKMSYGFYKTYTGEKYKYHLSADSTKLLVTYKLLPRRKGQAKEIRGFYVFDENLNKLSDIEMKMPYPETAMEVLDVTVDNHGVVYVLLKVYNDPHNQREHLYDKAPKYHFEIFKTGNGKREPEIVKIDPGARFPVSYKLTTGIKDELFCIGYYSEEAQTRSVHGMFFYSFPQPSVSMAEYHRYFYELPEATVRQYKKPGWQEEDYFPYGLVPVSFRTQADGSLLIFAEEMYVTTYTRMDATGISTPYESYHNDDIYVTRLSAGATMEWVSKIPKRDNAGSGYETWSYFAEQDNESLVIYMDDARNLDLDTEHEPFDANDRSVMVCARVKADGSITRQLLYDLRKENEDMNPQNIVPIASGIFGTLIYDKNGVKPISFTWK